MPEHTKKRPIWEKKMLVMLRKCNKKMRTRVFSYMGLPPNRHPRNVPQYIWDEVEKDCQADTTKVLIKIFGYAFAAMIPFFGYFVRGIHFAAKKEEHKRKTEERWAEIARKKTDRIRQELAKRAMEAEENQESVDWAAELDKQFDLPKDKTDPPTPGEKKIAITETTEQITRGEEAYVKILVDGEAISFDRIWHTERDSKVCPICTPLDRVSESVWHPLIPDGPPAHPNCRCWLTYRIKKFAVGDEIGLEEPGDGPTITIS